MPHKIHEVQSQQKKWMDCPTTIALAHWNLQQQLMGDDYGQNEIPWANQLELNPIY